MFERHPRSMRVMLVVLSVVVLAACGAPAPPASNATQPTAASTVAVAVTAVLPTAALPTAALPAAALPTAVPADTITPAAPATLTPGATAGVSSDALNEIKTVIQQANQEQVQAVASQNPAVMQDTATASYYQQSVKNLNDLLGGHVSAIQLVKLDWGPITQQDATTVQATTSETWSTTFADGSTMQETDTNVYILVLEGGAWKVQDDQHPNSGGMQNPSGAANSKTDPAPVVTPVAPAASGSSESSNWSGYAATPGTFTAVSGSWTVPSVSAATPGVDATWVGIGGLNSHDLIQAGTEAVVDSGQVSYSAWWEILPQVAQPVPLMVSAGDTISASISQNSDGTWQIVLRDATNGQSWQKSVAYHSSRSSAEWIEEAPAMGRRTLLPLDDFGTVTFTGATAVENGRSVTVAQAGGQPITMSTRGAAGGQALAEPSALAAGGDIFSITRTGTPAAAPGNVPGGRRVP